MSFLPSTVNRVSRFTPDAFNERIERDMQDRLDYFSHHKGEIAGRLEELDREWDIERTLEANAATLILAGVGTSILTRDHRPLALPLLVSGFLLQHALQGWCPPVPLFRHMGIRTQFEIEQERYALKAIRGDFNGVSTDGDDRTGGMLRVVRLMRILRR